MARHFAHWLKTYTEHTSIGESPVRFNLWTGISTVAGALGRKVWIDELSYQWYPNFFVVLVGPAGVAKKSTSIDPGMEMLGRVEGVHFGPNSATWQSLAKSLQMAAQDISLTLPDGTVDIITCSPITIPISEMGTFFKMEDSVMMDVLVDLYDSKKSWTHSTLTSGETQIKNVCMNIIACTTPSWIKRHFPEHQIGGGLASRLLFVFAETRRTTVAYPSQLVRPSNYYATRDMLVDDLKEIAKIKGQYHLTSEALVWGTKWYRNMVEGIRPSHLASDRYDAYLGRKQAHVHKLAMILSAAQHDQLVIEQSALEESVTHIEMLETSMLRVFESIGKVDEARHVDELVNFLRTYESLTSDELFSLVSNVITSRDFTASLRAAVTSGKLKVTKKGNKQAVMLNPELRKKEKENPDGR